MVSTTSALACGIEAGAVVFPKIINVLGSVALERFDNRKQLIGETVEFAGSAKDVGAAV